MKPTLSTKHDGLAGSDGAFTDADFPAGGPPEAQVRFLLHFATLAPSVLNTQPWRFEIEENLLCLYADPTRQLRVLDPAGRALTLSCGAALLNFRVAARHFGFRTEVYPFPYPADPTLLASVVIAAGRLPVPFAPPGENEALYRAIPTRSTNRHPFANRPIPTDVEAELVRAAGREGAVLTLVKRDDEKGAIARLVEEGVRRQGARPDVVDEIEAWLRMHDALNGVLDSAEALWDRHAAMTTPPSALAAHVRTLLAESPVLLVLSTEADAARPWLAAGQALERVLLVATSHGLSASFVNQPVEVEELREALARLVGVPAPQVVFRLGYTRGGKQAPRRPLRDMLKVRRPPHAHRIPPAQHK